MLFSPGVDFEKGGLGVNLCPVGALFALARNEPSKAIELLQPSLAYDFAVPGTAFAANFGGLYPAMCAVRHSILKA